MKAGAKKAAKLAGQSRYVGGRPCPKGHVGERYTANGKCCLCQNLRLMLYKRRTRRPHRKVTMRQPASKLRRYKRDWARAKYARAKGR